MVPETNIPLTKATIGEPFRLVRLEGGRGLQRRLAELGLTPGVNLRVLQDCGGPLLIAIRSSRIALGRGMANKITVSPIKEAHT
jgi:Fe2+ transport system protein FeoA